jgi:antitoxin ParD1/3/4
VYDRYDYDAEKREALERWARRLQAIIDWRDGQGRRDARSVNPKHGRIVAMAGTPITVTLPPELEAFIEERVASGRFATPGEAVREGLRLLEEREQEREAVLTELRQEIEIGVEQAKAGELTDGSAFFEQLRQKIRAAS